MHDWCCDGVVNGISKRKWLSCKGVVSLLYFTVVCLIDNDKVKKF